MEFHEKLQELRKQKNLTQEEVAACLYVSRAAVSKWESGRGYPNIDSLKAIARFYDVSIDRLLSGDEVLDIAQADQKQQENRFRERVFGLLDCCALCYLFLPLFAQRTAGAVHSVSLLAMTGGAEYMKIAYLVFVFATTALGVLTLSMKNLQWRGSSLSLGMSAAGVLLFSLSLQPYGAAFGVALLMVKVFLMIKKR